MQIIRGCSRGLRGSAGAGWHPLTLALKSSLVLSFFFQGGCHPTYIDFICPRPWLAIPDAEGTLFSKSI